MTYRKRLTLAAVCSLAAHIAVLAPGGCGPKPQGLALLRNDPIVLELRPETVAPPPPRRQVVDAPTAAQEPVEDTDLIAETASKAADNAAHDADTAAPRVEEVTDFDHTAAEPEPAPAPMPKPPQARENERQQPARGREQVAAVTPHNSLEEMMLHDEPGAAEPQPDTAFEPARPETPSAPVSLAPRASSGRVQGGVKRAGVLAFEALESEIAPYLKEIQRRVELNWRTALHLRYSGSSRTVAVLDCVIGLDGHIISVDIVDAGDSVTFAPLCKRAIESAGPFDPFPFEVPEVYRSRNLEIRWTFNFL